MKKLMIVSLMVVAALTASAQKRSTTRKGAVGADGGATVSQEKDAAVKIQTPAQPRSSLLPAPSVDGQSNISNVAKKPRKWIAPEMIYQTKPDWIDELTLTWHILLDAKTVKKQEKPSKDKEPASRFSYYTTAVRYVNIPSGDHAACVVLPPSVLERYGEPVAIAVLITDKEGKICDGSNIGAEAVVGKKLADKWWENSEQVMSATDSKTGVPLIARRQGLLDRSKTIFALVNPNAYEMVQQ